MTAKLGISFMAHSTLVNVGELNGSFLGYHHHSIKSSIAMVHSIADNMKKLLLDFIKSQDKPIGLILGMFVS